MRYINKLETENKLLLAQIQQAREEVEFFLAHAYSPKFTGTESNGERRDWIAIGDVRTRLLDIRSTLNPQ